ncbi:MAG: rhomboid family intramembrane serine protease [Duncaniella sp.]|nr:rhomboid family intramembrane serine protease [Duncaniella sp.]MDE6188179.1 rhomboid family intramembrane serine protease [Duncaniella sp.]
MGVTDTMKQMRRSFDGSTMLMKIIWINIGIFILLRVSAIVCMFAGRPDFINIIMSYIQLPSDPATLVTRPWTIATYMFAQYDVLHILFNLLWLYWFGTLFMMVATQRQLFALYILGGLGGAFLFLVCYAIMPVFAFHSAMLIGSSASVIAIVTATAILMPDFRMHLLFIGSISLKWIAIATIALVLIGVTGNNAGGEIAHIGGVLTGAIYALRLKRGHDITDPFNRTFDRMANLWNRFASTVWGSFSSKAKNSAPNQASGRRQYQADTTPPPYGKTPTCDDNDREVLDAILDKIKKSGYSALTPQERQRLFDVSRKIK